MPKTFIEFIAALPPFIGKEIFKYILPNPDLIEFRYRYDTDDQINSRHDNYNHRYLIAYIHNSILLNKRGVYLSRIFKYNGKHRYYLTTENIKSYCGSCGNHYRRCTSLCDGFNCYEFHYSSRYVGKNIERALLELEFAERDDRDDEDFAL